MTVEFWDEQARTLDGAKRIVWSLDNYEDGIAECLDHIVPWVDGMADGSQILDLGCGIGRLTVPLALRYPSCWFVGLDHSYQMLVHADAARAAAGVDNIEWVQGSLRRLRQLDSFDGAFSFAVLQHIDPAGQHDYVDAVARLLSARGWFRFQWHAIGGEDDRGPLANPVDIPTMTDWVREAGLVVEAIEPHPGLPSLRWMTARK